MDFHLYLIPMSHKGSDADPMVFGQKLSFLGDDLMIIGLLAGHLRLQLAIGVPSGQVKFFSDTLPIFSIIEPSAGNLVMPARPS